MLRRLDLKSSWRSLEKGFWPDDIPSGHRTVVYGHNGSGKSTLAELLLSLAQGTTITGVAWEDENKQSTNVEEGSSGPSSAMAVFTRKWVEENLSAFLAGEGAGASAIVTLGKEAIDAKEEEKRLTQEIAALHEDTKEADAQHTAAAAKVEKMARDLQERIVSELKEFNYNYFTKNQFTVPRVQARLREHQGEFPDINAHAEALKRLGEGAPSPVPEIAAPRLRGANQLTDLAGLLDETPTRTAIELLEENSSAQAWVEQGIALHESLDHCFFCAGGIDDARRDQLARHFDESWLQIRHRAHTLLEAVTEETAELVAWGTTLPATTALVGELQPTYADAVARAKADVNDRVAALTALQTALETKVADPSTTPEAPDWSVLNAAPSSTVLTKAVKEHNDKAQRHAEVTSDRTQVILDHLFGSHSQNFIDAEKRSAELASQSQQAAKSAEIAERNLEEVRQARFTTKQMADTLTQDLARVYGKNHLSVAVISDGKSYTCRRGDKPGTDLSDGERATLSLLYFLRNLEDEQIPGSEPSQRIVVIDDPSSSLDREALFATHQWLVDTLQGFGQYFVLTHDFSLLRLFIKSQSNRWGNSMKKIKDGNLDEIRFPGVSFLEMYATSVEGERRSRVARLPDMLRNNTSEYAYLFSMVMAGIADPGDHERLFLLPNAARRVLEVFASYKAPDLPDFLPQLEALVKDQSGEPYRDVYDFCNRFSHGEGSEIVDALDARAVHSHIRRSMKFLRAADPDHFERMCKATKVSSATL